MKKLHKSASLADYQSYIKIICEEKGWNKRSDIEKMLFLTEEVGELAKAVRKEHGGFGYQTPETKEHLEEELVDVFNYVLDIANTHEVNLHEAFVKKWERNERRLWTS